MDYKEKLKLAKEALDSGSYDKETIEYIFPELAESEDEKIRKELITFIKQEANSATLNANRLKFKSMLAWLERQGEQKPIISDDALREGIAHFGITQYQIDNWLKKYVDIERQGEKQKTDLIMWKPVSEYKGGRVLATNDVDILVGYINSDGDCESEDCEGTLLCGITGFVKIENILPKPKQGEQKPVDKVEPKFKVGDWITNGIDFTLKVMSIKDNMYYRDDGYFIDVETADKTFRLWTIDDAKEGDVLVCDDDKTPFIFKGLLDHHHPNCPVAYCGIDNENEFIVSSGISWWDDCKVEPATKEQRDLLFSKIKEAGYEWSADKKTLVMIGIDNDEEDERYEELMEDNETSIKQNPADFYCEEHCKGFQETGKCYADGECKAKRDAEQKPTWSEEDEKNLGITILALEKPFDYEGKFDRKAAIQWLKSLKPQPQWKPTEQQMNCFKQVIDLFKMKVNDDSILWNLNSLYKELENLYEQEG